MRWLTVESEDAQCQQEVEEEPEEFACKPCNATVSDVHGRASHAWLSGRVYPSTDAQLARFCNKKTSHEESAWRWGQKGLWSPYKSWIGSTGETAL